MDITKNRAQFTQLELIKDIIEEEIYNRESFKNEINMTEQGELRNKTLPFKNKVKKLESNRLKNRKKVLKAKKYAERWKKWRSLSNKFNLNE